MKIYHLEEKEAHMFGDMVGVVWNTSIEKKRLQDAGGTTYTAEVPVRKGKPYIDFLWIREEDTDSPYEDEDSPISGGISLKVAAKLSNELNDAISYLRKIESEVEKK